MRIPKSNKNSRFRSRLFANSIPRAHLLSAGIIAASTILLTLLLSDNVEANRRVDAIELPGSSQHSIANLKQATATSQSGTSSAQDRSGAQLSVSTDSDNTGDREWLPTTLVNGDNLTSTFRRLGLDDSDVYLVANAKSQAEQLEKLRPGESIAVAIDGEGQLEEVRYSRSRLEHYLYKRDGDAFAGEKVLNKPELIATFKQGIIENSLFLDAGRAGLSEAKIMEQANIFGWDIDFALDIRRGDRFSVLYEEQYFEGEKVGDGNILAASFTNQGATYDAVLFKETDGSLNYYAADGKPMRKAFLRAPLDFTRISSNFDLRRKHPIHKMIKAHRGVDYAAPRGTPVYAAGSGKVVASGYSKANGNYVFIKHGEQFVTKYLHLDRRKARTGQSVKQHQTIGTVGSTGYATGPHLHYEFLVNGVHQNPRTVKLPEAQAIASSKKAEFISQTTPLLAQLRLRGAAQIATVRLGE